MKVCLKKMNELTRNETLVIIVIAFAFGIFVSYIVTNFAFHTKPDSISVTSKIGGSSTSALNTPATSNVLTTGGTSPVPTNNKEQTNCSSARPY